MQNSSFISNSEKLKNAFKIAAFILLLLLALYLVSDMLSLKSTDGIAQWDVFYDIEEDTLDVLVIGSSHAFVNINPVVMYESEGVAAFNLCSTMQPMWNSYYFIKEALKYQKPKLIVLEGYGVCYKDDYTDYEQNPDISARVIKNNYGMKWSLNKIESIVNSVPKERSAEFLISLIQTHNRYEELSNLDFYELADYPKGRTWRGQADHFSVAKQNAPDEEILRDTGIGGITSKTEEYYRKILQLANEEDIPVLVMYTPYPGIKQREKIIFNAAEKIADEYGADFIDFNTSAYYEEIGLDFTTDYVDIVHMNAYGNEKFSKFFADYLMDNYDLTDRRGDENYIDWEEEVAVRKQLMLDNAK